MLDVASLVTGGKYDEGKKRSPAILKLVALRLVRILTTAVVQYE
jgi:hypothetical protein